jgi:hypothetical protein
MLSSSRALRMARGAALVLLAAAATSCGDMQREGTASSFLIVNALEAAPGSDPTKFSGSLSSDVETEKSVFADVGRVSLSLGMKDPGTATSPTAPTSANFITLTQYHVRYIRSDGRQMEGVDVPYAFDGGISLTVKDGDIQGAFTIVRQIAKNEAPLRALTTNGLIISTVAEVTFYGHDQTGRDVSAVARISIDFANFADKTS